MSSYTKAAKKLLLAVLLVSFLCVNAAAQVTIQPKDEIFGGYSWLGISGYADFDIKVQDINAGFDASTHGIFRTPTTWASSSTAVATLIPADPAIPAWASAWADCSTSITPTRSRRLSGMMGGIANLSPAYPPTPPNGSNEWNAAFAAGGGIDYDHPPVHDTYRAGRLYLHQLQHLLSGVIDGACVPSDNLTVEQCSVWRRAWSSTWAATTRPRRLRLARAQPTEVTEGEPVT